MCTIFRELPLVHSSRDNSWKIAADRIEHRNLYPYYANHETAVFEPSPKTSFVSKYISDSRQRVTKERRILSLPGTRFRPGHIHTQEVASAVSFAPVPPGGRNEISNICYFPSPTFVLRTEQTASDFIWSGAQRGSVPGLHRSAVKAGRGSVVCVVVSPLHKFLLFSLLPWWIRPSGLVPLGFNMKIWILQTLGWTPSMGDQPVARPLLTQGTTNTGK